MYQSWCRAGVFSDVLRDLEVTKSTGTLGVRLALGNALAVKRGHLLE